MKKITAQDVKILMNDKESVHLIDVREVDEVKNGKIPGALHIPLYLLEARMPELNKKYHYIMVCHTGGRSSQATRFLEGNGYKVSNMTGGMLAWDGLLE